jgi:hypothetical protein
MERDRKLSFIQRGPFRSRFRDLHMSRREDHPYRNTGQRDRQDSFLRDLPEHVRK